MNPSPSKIELNQQQRILRVDFGSGESFTFTCHYLRVLSPSAEVRGHGKGQEKCVDGKQNVNIVAIEPVGNYAVKLVFDDGHDSGIYSWNYFWDNGQNMHAYWQAYQQRCPDRH